MSGYGQSDPRQHGTGADSERMEPSVNYRLRNDGNRDGVFRDDSASDDGSEGFEMSLAELLYSTSSFYAIVVPGMHRKAFSTNHQLLQVKRERTSNHSPILPHLISYNHNGIVCLGRCICQH